MTTKTYDQYHPTPDGRTPGPLDSCQVATSRVIELFGLPIQLRGGAVDHLGDGVYGVECPRTVDISTEEGLYDLLFGPMHGAVRLIVSEPRKIEVFGCSGCFEWEVA